MPVLHSLVSISIVLLSTSAVVSGVHFAAQDTSSERADLPLAARAGRPPPKRYVHLGDSWASGIGTFPRLIIGTDPGCLQTDSSFAEQYAKENNLTADAYLNLSCAPQNLPDMVEKAQGIPPDTELVSYLGDVNIHSLAEIVQLCELDGGPQQCKGARERAFENHAYFFIELGYLMQAIRKRAKGARIVVMGFPRPYGSVNGRATKCNPSGADQQARAGRDDINAVLEGLVRPSQENNFIIDSNVIYMDADAVFDYHRYCDKDSWFASLARTKGPDPFAWNNGYFHPNTAGHTAYKNLLTEAWNRP